MTMPRTGSIEILAQATEDSRGDPTQGVVGAITRSGGA